MLMAEGLGIDVSRGPKDDINAKGPEVGSRK